MAKDQLKERHSYSGSQRRRGTTAERPVGAGLEVGFMYYDTTLNLPVFWNGTAWRNAAGTVA